MFAAVDKALDERTIGHNPERLNLLKGGIIYSNKVPPLRLEVIVARCHPRSPSALDTRHLQPCGTRFSA